MGLTCPTKGKDAKDPAAYLQRFFSSAGAGDLKVTRNSSDFVQLPDRRLVLTVEVQEAGMISVLVTSTKIAKVR